MILFTSNYHWEIKRNLSKYFFSQKLHSFFRGTGVSISFPSFPTIGKLCLPTNVSDYARTVEATLLNTTLDNHRAPLYVDCSMRDCIDFLPCLSAWQFTPDRLNIFVSPLIKMELCFPRPLGDSAQNVKFLQHHISGGAHKKKNYVERGGIFFLSHIEYYSGMNYTEDI